MSLKNSLKRSGIDAQFSAINEHTKTMGQVSGFSNQKEVSCKHIDAIPGKDLDKARLAAEGYYVSGLSNGELGLVKTTTDFITPLANDLPEWDMLYLGCFQNVHVNNKGGQRSPFYQVALSKNQGYDFNLCPSESLESIPGTPWKKMTGRLPIDEMYRILVERGQTIQLRQASNLIRENKQ